MRKAMRTKLKHRKLEIICLKLSIQVLYTTTSRLREKKLSVIYGNSDNFRNDDMQDKESTGLPRALPVSLAPNFIKN